MAAAPTVSICVPAYQAEYHLRKTLDSVLAQDHSSFEVVVVDNHSTDGTRAILDGFHDDRLRIIRNSTTLPMVENFNTAVRNSRGRYVKLVCADDLLRRDCVRRQAKVLDEQDDVVLVSARTDFVDDHGDLMRPARGLAGITGRHTAPEVARAIVRSGTNPIGAPVATMFRRSDFDRVGGFAEGPRFVTDLELWIRLLAHGAFYGLADTLASFRLAGESATARMSSRAQRAEQVGIVDTLATDPRWGITGRDSAVGRLRAVDMQIRRNGLYAWSSLRRSSARRRMAHAPATGGVA
jgi:glycosyltransferase involved in cell wall biosynthesis